MNFTIDVKKYLGRIGYAGSVVADAETLKGIHECHIKAVPFENLDIHYRRPFDLRPDKVFQKVVDARRGGFCYELNSLFHVLLRDLTFDCRIISGRVFNDEGVAGPEFDHMALLVQLDALYLVDVGFGDLFISPLQIVSERVQSDGRNRFVMHEVGDDNFELSMATRKGTFVKKYVFDLKEATVEQFEQMCFDKQVNPSSHFVKNTICTRATDNGRITIYNDKLIEKADGKRSETIIPSDDALRIYLREKFDIVVR